MLKKYLKLILTRTYIILNEYYLRNIEIVKESDLKISSCVFFF